MVTGTQKGGIDPPGTFRPRGTYFALAPHREEVGWACSVYQRHDEDRLIATFYGERPEMAANRARLYVEMQMEAMGCPTGDDIRRLYGVSPLASLLQSAPPPPVKPDRDGLEPYPAYP